MQDRTTRECRLREVTEYWSGVSGSADERMPYLDAAEYVFDMITHLSPGASGAIRRFAGWVARGSVGHPLLDEINYWDELKDSPSQMETCFAIFANVLELNEHGIPINEKYAERRAATWLYQYCTGELPPGEPDLEPWECELF